MPFRVTNTRWNRVQILITDLPSGTFQGSTGLHNRRRCRRHRRGGHLQNNGVCTSWRIQTGPAAGSLPLTFNCQRSNQTSRSAARRYQRKLHWMTDTRVKEDECGQRTDGNKASGLLLVRFRDDAVGCEYCYHDESDDQDNGSHDDFSPLLSTLSARSDVSGRPVLQRVAGETGGCPRPDRPRSCRSEA